MSKPASKQAEILNGYHRRTEAASDRTTVSATISALPTLDDLAGAPEPVLEALRHWYELVETRRTHAREQAKAATAAENASAAYRQKVRDAVSSGEDPSKIKDETDKHRATAAAHRGFYSTADSQLQRHGVVLGEVLAEHAEAMAPLIDERLAEAAERVRASVAALDETWIEWSSAFGLRTWLSSIAFEGGSVPAFHGGDRHRAAVSAAIAPMLGLLQEPDKLRHDERVVREWRAEQAAARAWQVREFGTNQ